MDISGITSALPTQYIASSAAPAPASSAVLLAHLAVQLNIQAPTPVEAKVLATGTLNPANLPATLEQTLSQSSINTGSASPGFNAINTSPQSTNPLQWARLQLANSPAILAVSQSLPKLLQIGQVLTVILDASGKLSLVTPSNCNNLNNSNASNLGTVISTNTNTAKLPNIAIAQPSSIQLSPAEPTTTQVLASAMIVKTIASTTSLITTGLPQPKTSEANANPTLDLPAARPATLNAIRQLTQSLIQQTAPPTRPSRINQEERSPNTPQTLPSTAGLTAVAQLNDALKLLPASLQQQLLPPKIQALIAQLPLQPSASTLAAELSETLKPATIDTSMVNLQSVVNLLKRIVGSEKIATTHASTFLSLIAGLPSMGAKHEQIQQSRIAIAKWLAGEFTNAITQRSLNHSASLGMQAEARDTAFIQQDVPLKWGDAIANLHITVEEHHQQAEAKNHKKTQNRAKSNQWSVNMTLELPDNKTLGVEIKLAAIEIDIALWSSDAMLLKSINGNIEHLKSNLQSAGLTINSLECRQGLRPSQQQGLSQTLIDVVT